MQKLSIFKSFWILMLFLHCFYSNQCALNTLRLRLLVLNRVEQSSTV